jgi:hypothetical protein
MIAKHNLGGLCFVILSRIYSRFVSRTNNNRVSGRHSKIWGQRTQRNTGNHGATIIIILTFMVPCIVNIFLKYNQQDVTLCSILYCCQCSTCFRRFFRPSPGAHTVPTASGICRACLLLPLAWVSWKCQLTHSSGSSKQARHTPDAACPV